MDLFSYMLGKKSGGAGGGSGDSVDAEKLDLYERYFRAMKGESAVDWNPQPIDPNETATFEEAPEKYQITVTTRGITYTVPCDVPAFIYPDMTIEAANPGNNSTMDNYIGGFYRGETNAVDYSRVNITHDGKDFRIRPIMPGVNEGSSSHLFFALPEHCSLGDCRFWMMGSRMFEQGLSFGKTMHRMSANSIGYSLVSQGDKPVYVMEGFTGNLYLAKLNISAEHLVGIINNLGEGSYTLNIGSHNTEKLTAEQIAVATEKGWNVT